MKRDGSTRVLDPGVMIETHALGKFPRRSVHGQSPGKLGTLLYAIAESLV